MENLLRFITQTLTGQFIFGLQLISSGLLYACFLPVRKPFLCRLLPAVCIYFLFLWFLPDLTVGTWFHLPPLIIFAAFILLLWFLFDADLKKIFFCALASFATQHLAVAVTDAVRAALQLPMNGAGWVFACAGSFLLIFTICFFLFARLIRYIPCIEMQTIKLTAISAIILSLVYLLRIFSFDQLRLMENVRVLTITSNLYAAIGSLASLIILFSMNREDALVEEKRMIEQLLYEREEQHRFARETIDVINLKCHDLKHQIAMIRAERNPGSQEEALREVEDAVLIYDKVAKTGNETLDAILTEKSLYCEKYNITLTYMVDGSKLKFMRVTDLYSLFGNALDNAIEAVLQEQDPEKRIISLQVFEKKDYLCIHMENYYDRPLIFKDGSPVTWKKEKQYHGFGIKSIRYIAQKYHGNVTMNAANQLFCLDILFPIRQFT